MPKVTVYRHKQSRFWHYDFIIKGRRFSGSTRESSKRKAEARAARILLEAEARTLGGRRPEVSLGEATRRYFEDAGQHESNWQTTSYQLERLAAAFGDGLNLSDLTDDAVAAYVARRRGEPHSKYKKTKGRELPRVAPATVNRELELLRRVCYRARDHWGFEVAPIRWKAHRLKEAGETTRVLSEAEQTRLMAELAPHLRAPVRFTLLTGVRAAECFSLDWRQVDMTGRVITFRTKGDRELLLPITDELRALLASLGPKDSGPVFARTGRPAGSRGPKKPLPVTSYRTAFKGALRRAGIDNFRWHDLRHTAASRMVARGANLAWVQEVLGHSNIATTRRYTHVDMDMKRQALEALETPQRSLKVQKVQADNLGEKDDGR